MNLGPLLAKELKELARSYKLLFVPVVFAIVAIGQPLAIKLMPRIISGATNLPKGAVIQIPVPPPDEVVASMTGQLGQTGIFVLVLVAMGAIAGERASGVAATVLTKPVGRGEYLAAKALSYGLLAALSTTLAMAAGAYYTQLLIGPVSWGNVALGTLLYLPNLLLAVALTLCFSAFLPSPLAAGGAGLAALIFLNVVPGYLGKFIASIYPGALSESARRMLTSGHAAAARPLAGVLALVLVALLAGWFALERQEI